MTQALQFMECDMFMHENQKYFIHLGPWALGIGHELLKTQFILSVALSLSFCFSISILNIETINNNDENLNQPLNLHEYLVRVNACLRHSNTKLSNTKLFISDCDSENWNAATIRIRVRIMRFIRMVKCVILEEKNNHAFFFQSHLQNKTKRKTKQKSTIFQTSNQMETLTTGRNVYQITKTFSLLWNLGFSLFQHMWAHQWNAHTWKCVETMKKKKKKQPKLKLNSIGALSTH